MREEREKRWQEFIQQNQVIMQEMFSSVREFQGFMLGVKKRGMAGEEILKFYLKEPIKIGLIKTNVITGGGVVEFAFDLGDGKFIPIDPRFPKCLVS
ncbi:MAG: hypothetical protein QXP42_00140 [Candidatus Micrarchaeia archaeon]